MGINLGWAGRRSLLIYAGIPAAEVLLLGLVTARTLRGTDRRRPSRVLVALWAVNGLNLMLGVGLGAFGLY